MSDLKERNRKISLLSPTTAFNPIGAMMLLTVTLTDSLSLSAEEPPVLKRHCVRILPHLPSSGDVFI